MSQNQAIVTLELLIKRNMVQERLIKRMLVKVIMLMFKVAVANMCLYLCT